MIVLIPAYEPATDLVRLVRELRAADADTIVVIVDDGSSAAYAPVFTSAGACGAVVLRCPVNRGKGAALKAGFALVVDAYPGEDVVTADADGQHTVHDILRVADALRAEAGGRRSSLVLGCRRFDGAVPWRSRAGNAASRGLFHAVAGWRLSDTQTGLRGIPAPMLAWLLTVPGDRFEYEQSVLLHLRPADFGCIEVPIATVYLAGNRSSHFRPVVDSLRVLRPVLAFAGSSLLGFAVDTVALLVLTALTGWLVPSIVAARLLSATVNFALNRRLVFGRRGNRKRTREAAMYALLAATLLASNIIWMAGLTSFGLPLLVAKVITEVTLFILSYRVQQDVVFRRRGFIAEAQDAEGAPIVRVDEMVSTPTEHRSAA